MGLSSSISQEEMSKIATTVENIIASNEVAIFSKSYCPFCDRVKSLFNKVVGGSGYKVIELDEMKEGSAIQNYLAQRTGQRTVPNVFIRGHHVGGNDDTHAAHRQGKLTTLLKGEWAKL